MIFIVVIELKGGQTILLAPLDGTASFTFRGFGVTKPVTALHAGGFIEQGADQWPIRLDAATPVVSGKATGMEAVKEVRLG
ncbi:hypothetical protein HY967_01420 [Candidatus Jorgensenbacteria bacterium]|nr:hypothetical protein [Candidatus Jorgensenbacteria bacterium]